MKGKGREEKGRGWRRKKRGKWDLLQGLRGDRRPWLKQPLNYTNITNFEA